MSKEKKPQAGEWWFINGRNDRVYIVGRKHDGRIVFQPDRDMVLVSWDYWSSWHHEPRCTGWDWQPEPEPEWFDLTPFDEHMLRSNLDRGRRGDGEWRAPTWSVVGQLNIGYAKTLEWTEFRCLLKDAPPELVAKAKAGECIHTFDCGSGDHSDACPASVPESQKPETYHRYVTPFGQEFWLRETGETRRWLR